MKYSGDKIAKQYFLYNIKTNEQLQLHATQEQLTTVIVEIIKNKYYKAPDISDEKFLSMF